MFSKSDLAAIRMLGDVIVEAVGVAGPQGAPAGALYLAMSQAGCTLGQFEKLMGALVAIGRLEHKGHLYFVGQVN